MRTSHLLGILVVALGATAAAAGQQFVQFCQGSYCFQGFIERISPLGNGVLFKVKTKNVGSDSSTKEKSIDYRWSVVSCNKDDAYVSSGRERIEVDHEITHGPLRSVHVAQEADELWKAVCMGR